MQAYKHTWIQQENTKQKYTSATLQAYQKTQTKIHIPNIAELVPDRETALLQISYGQMVFRLYSI